MKESLISFSDNVHHICSLSHCCMVYNTHCMVFQSFQMIIFHSDRFRQRLCGNSWHGGRAQNESGSKVHTIDTWVVDCFVFDQVRPSHSFFVSSRAYRLDSGTSSCRVLCSPPPKSSSFSIVIRYWYLQIQRVYLCCWFVP